MRTLVTLVVAVWPRPATPQSPAAAPSAEFEGRQLFSKLQCATCHAEGDGRKGPVLDGLYGKELPVVGAVSAGVDAVRVRQKILNGGARGWQLMPAYKDKVSADELSKLTAFVLAMKPLPKKEPGPRGTGGPSKPE